MSLCLNGLLLRKNEYAHSLMYHLTLWEKYVSLLIHENYENGRNMSVCSNDLLLRQNEYAHCL